MRIGEGMPWKKVREIINCRVCCEIMSPNNFRIYTRKVSQS